MSAGGTNAGAGALAMRVFVDALRAALRLAPLYGSDASDALPSYLLVGPDPSGQTGRSQ